MASPEPPPLTLRPLQTPDAPALQAVYDAATDYFELATGQPPAAGQAERDLAGTVQEEGRHILGIFLRDSLIGVVELRLAQPRPFDVRLGLILLNPAYRRQGLGSWALRILEEWLRQATPTETVMLAVLAHNIPAQAFFQHLGYRFTGQATRVVVGGRRLRLLAMEKKL